MGRTKCTKLVTNVLAPAFKNDLLADIGGCKFSLLIDESTDISVTSVLCLVIRYMSRSKRKIVSSFYRYVTYINLVSDTTQHSKVETHKQCL